MRKLYDLLKTYRELVSYLVFGGLTTLVNFLCYFILEGPGGIHYVGANIIAWFIAMLFAFVTNRLFVFQMKDHRIKTVLREFISFGSMRVLSGALETGILFFFVDKMGFSDAPVKVAAAVMVVILNYIFSKLLIFKKES